MTYIATTIYGDQVKLEPVCSVQINKSRETPADGLVAVFPCSGVHEEYRGIDVYLSSEQKFFSGIVDEQKVEVTGQGCFLTISARSQAARLIDNEASPQTYKRPSLDIIFERHVKPYGFSSISGDKSSFNYTIDVEKGMSEWDVLENFCSACLRVFPIIKADGTVDATGKAEDVTLQFSNLAGSGINYSTIRQRINRYKRMSEVIVCAPYDVVYVARVRDQDAIDKGISRRKFISMSALDGDSAKQISVDTAEKMIELAKSKAAEFQLTCPGAIYAQIGNACRIDDSVLGRVSDLAVYEVEYRLDQTGERTVITMLKEGQR